ncbi:MAG TPA: hypothetical protein VKE40_01115 [Gemmataceae bacterium]|nr:hypothetical protein [Gemmataceae bacterium]
MSAEQWESADLKGMLSLAAGRLSPRKLDLFNVWCCHTLRPYLTDRRSLAAVRYAEEHVDKGWPDTPEWAAVRDAAQQAVDELTRWVRLAPNPAELRNRRVFAHSAKVAQQAVTNDLPNRGVISNAQFSAYAHGWANDDEPDTFFDDTPASDALRQARVRLQEAVFRDIVGNPFHPVAFDPRWWTSDAVGLARAIYEDRASARMPILADALMDAGCADDTIIGHCRGPGPHVRGCWVVDLVLGKG